MNCPSCGNPLPEEAGQRAVSPGAGVVDCPNCGARVSLATGQLEAGVSPEGGAEDKGGVPIQGGQPERSSLEETVEGVMEQIDEKEQS